MKHKINNLQHVLSILKNEMQQAENKIGIFISINSIAIALMSSVLIFVRMDYGWEKVMIFMYLGFMLLSLMTLLLAAFPKIGHSEDTDTIYYFRNWDSIGIDEYTDEQYESDIIKTIKAYRRRTRRKNILIVIAAALMIFPLFSIVGRLMIKSHMK